MTADVNTVVTSSRDKRRSRPIGYATWSPQQATRGLLKEVEHVLDRYADHLPLTIRQVFYVLVGAGHIDKAENAYERLCEHLNRARRAQLISFDDLRDDGVMVSARDTYDGLDAFHEDTARRAIEYRRDRQAGQMHRIELWCEAAGMIPQLGRVAAEFSVPVYSASGFVSLSGIRQIADRALAHTRPLVVLHVGDLDPSGESIYDRIARDARAFVHADRTTTVPDVIAERVALTREQVEQFELPTAPAKRTDSRSARWSGGTCQLEALPPDVLADVVGEAISRRLDSSLLERVIRQEQDDRAELLGLPRGPA